MTEQELMAGEGSCSVRPVTIADAPALFLLMSDPTLTRFLTWSAHTTEAETASVIHDLLQGQTAGKAFHWVAIEHEKPAGLISLIDIRHTHRSWRVDRAELAYWIASPFQGRGIATQCCRLVVKLGFGQLNLQKIIIANAEGNLASERVAQHLGSRQIGIEQRAFQKDGQWHNLVWHEILRPDIR